MTTPVERLRKFIESDIWPDRYYPEDLDADIRAVLDEIKRTKTRLRSPGRRAPRATDGKL